MRVERDLGPARDPIKTKIAEGEKARVHTMLVIGGRDVDTGAQCEGAVSSMRTR